LLTVGGVYAAASGVSGLFAGTGLVLTLAAGAAMILARPPRREENVAAAAKA